MKESKFLSELKLVLARALIEFINLLYTETVSSVSLFSSEPLFSCIVTFCTLIFLYLPNIFWKIILSPVLVLAGILLLIILRLGAIQRSENEQKENEGKSVAIFNEENRVIKEEKEGKPVELAKTNSLEQVHQWITSYSEIDCKSQRGLDSNSCFEVSFMDWNVKTPLEVIHEEYEGEEAGQDSNERQDALQMGISRYPSLSRYYPESDSNSSSESGFSQIENLDSPENFCCRWDEEDGEGLFEIALDGCKKKALEFHFEEDNLIEIDISPTRYKEFSGEDNLFTGEITCN